MDGNVGRTIGNRRHVGNLASSIRPLRPGPTRLAHLTECRQQFAAVVHGEGLISHQTQAFPRELVHDGQNPKPAAIRHALAHKIHTPPLVRGGRPWLRHTGSARGLRAVLGPHRQPFVRIQSIDPFGVHLPALPSQQHRESPIPEAYSARRQLSQPHAQRLLRITATPIL